MVDPTDIEVLSRQGASAAVLAKKVLLSILATKEAARLGIAVTEADVDAVSSWFREAFGINSDDDLRACLEQTGLDLDGFRQVMRGFAAVSHVQAQYSAEIDSLMGIHEKIASIRKNRG